MRRWRNLRLSEKLAVCFIVYVVLGFPVLLFAGASIFGNTSAGESPAVAAFFVLLVGPIFVLPLAALALELRRWLKARGRLTEAP